VLIDTKAGGHAGLSICVFFAAKLFIPASQNKVRGTGDITELGPSPFVVGAGNEKHLRRNSMTNRFMMSVAAVALIAGAGFANAQGTGTNREQGSTAQQSAPSSDRGNSAQSKPSSDMKATQSEEKSPGAAKSQRAEDKASKPSSDMKATQSEEKSPGAAKSQRSEDKSQGPKSKSMSSENESKGSKDLKSEKDMKAESGKDMKAGSTTNKMNAEQKGAADSKSTTTQSQTEKSAPQSGQSTTQSQSGTSVQSQTTGQAGAAAKLSTEQRTRITSVIREQHVQPLTNVNFSIAVGTRVPRDVRFYPLPREVVTIYPEWRGYEFVLVNSQIIVIDPRTFEIVAILEV
jgi:Protein of unknown function (DUF1236)